MLTDCFGQRMSTSSATTLFLLLIINTYNLLWLHNDSLATGKLLGDSIETKKQIIAYQTLVLIFAIILSTLQNTSPILLLTRYGFFGTTFVTLIFDLLITIATAKYMLRSSALDEFWKIKTHQKELKAPLYFYFLVAVLLAVYFVFKFHAAVKIFRFGIDHRNENIDGSAAFIRNHDDIERNNSRDLIVSPALPPSYEQCMVESTPPPPYRDVQK